MPQVPGSCMCLRFSSAYVFLVLTDFLVSWVYPDIVIMLGHTY